MLSRTKMVIITSNEDIIQQFSLNKSEKTQIIDLDEDFDLTSLSTDQKNLTDLAFLAQLSELVRRCVSAGRRTFFLSFPNLLVQNPKSHEIYKTILNCRQDSESRSNKVPRKSLELTCVVCADRAIGFNYDALSCASCKAFFRRNAHQPVVSERDSSSHTKSREINLEKNSMPQR